MPVPGASSIEQKKSPLGQIDLAGRRNNALGCGRANQLFIHWLFVSKSQHPVFYPAIITEQI